MAEDARWDVKEAGVEEPAATEAELAGRVRALVTALLGASGDELRDDAHLVHDLGAQPSDLRDVARVGSG